ncbi:hypothetical protein ACQPWW_30650 [Micromonospora sp. CA-240977]|uniref:hypothetical protein n=1 Tax=Micromonospora sp. CA-240977 TaxID=3239957 RepID=UPI003D913ED8
MAFRTWGRLLLTALGVSMLAGAGQLGVAYGFGIVRLTGAFTGTTVNQWPAQLVWVGWFAANAAVAGAVLTGRLARSDAPAASTRRQLAIGGAAALGATVVAPLCMQPARAAELISVDPVWAVGICAILGAVIGAGAAIAVLFRPELGWNMAAVAGVVWLLALISVLPSLGTAGPLPTVRLGVLEPSWLSDATAQRLALLLLPTVALLAGAATAGLARWRGQDPLISGVTGVAGPVLVAFAYLTAGPGDAVDRYQVNPYYGSLIAILSGALGAAAAALLRWPLVARTTDSQAIEPSDILRALPTGPALPNAASPSPANDPDATERATAPSTDTEPAGSPAGRELAGGKVSGAELADAAPGPRAAGGSDGVRTVPAHWDWPATTASGQHGATPVAPGTPAAWLTDPTGEFTTGRQTPPVSRDEVTSPAETPPPAKIAAGSSTDTAPTSTATGRADAATAAGDPATDEPTGSTATGTTGGRATRKGTATSAPTGTTTTSSDNSSPGTASTTSTAAAARTATADASPAAADASPAAADASPAAADASPAAADASPAAADASPAAADAVEASPAAADAVETSPAAADAGGAKPGPVGAPPTVKPRRARKPKASPLAATDPADGTSASGSKTTDETVAGTAVPGQQGRDTEGTPTTEATPTTAAPTRAAVPTTRTGRTRTTATPTATGPTKTPTPITTTGPTKTPTPTTTIGPTKTPTPITTTGPIKTPTPTTGPTGAPATPTGTTAAADPPRTPDVVGTGPTAAPADPAGELPTAGAGGTNSARPTTEDGPAASDRGAGRWTPTQSAWPVTPAWTVPPQASESGAAEAEPPTGPDESTGQTPKPRHRMPLPDLSRAGTWNAFDTSRRAGPTGSPDSSTARPTTTGPAVVSELAAPARHPVPTDSPVGPDRVGAPTGTGNPARTDERASTGNPARTDDPARTGNPAGTDDPASTDATPAAPTAEKVAEQPSRRGRLGGLFRRNRSRSDEKGAEASDAPEALPAQDEEFVDWVAGLGKPVSDNEPEQESGRRSLRSTGRHHRD